MARGTKRDGSPTDAEPTGLGSVELQPEDRPVDVIIQRVIDKLAERDRMGQIKYQSKLSEEPASLYDRLNHLQEELLDASNYIEWLKALIGGEGVASK